MRSEPESFYSIRRTDGERISGEFTWLSADGPDDWTVAEESVDDEATEWEICRLVVEPIARRTLPECREPDCTATGLTPAATPAAATRERSRFEQGSGVAG